MGMWGVCTAKTRWIGSERVIGDSPFLQGVGGISVCLGTFSGFVLSSLEEGAATWRTYLRRYQFPHMFESAKEPNLVTATRVIGIHLDERFKKILSI